MATLGKTNEGFKICLGGTDRNFEVLQKRTLSDGGLGQRLGGVTPGS